MLEASVRGDFPQALGRIHGFAAVELLDSVRPLPVIYRRDVTQTSVRAASIRAAKNSASDSEMPWI